MIPASLRDRLCARADGAFGAAAFVTGYVLLAIFTLTSPGLPPGVDISRIIWLPSGLALAFIVQAGIGAWPWIFLAEAVVTGVTGDPLLGALGTGAGSTAEAVLAATLLSAAGFSPSLGRWRDVVALIVLGSGVSSLLGAVISVSALVWSGALPAAGAVDVGFRWWLSHANGILLLTPVLLTVCTGLGDKIRQHFGEAAATAALLVLVGWLLFNTEDPESVTRLLLYVPFPILLWSAFRFRLTGAALANLFLILPALAGTGAGRGPLAGIGPSQTVLQLAVFLTVTVLTSLILAGVVEEREEEATARLAAEEERRQMGERMHQAQKLESLGVLAGGIAHDFNNLLATIMGNADLAEKRLPLDHSAGDNVAEVLRASRRAADLCRQIQAYAGRGQVASSVLDLNEVVDEMGELLSVSFPNDAEVTIRLTSGLPPVWGDVTQIRQVVLNLLTNAADALPAGKGRIQVTTGELIGEDVVEADLVIGEPPSRATRLVHLTVEDDGPGMDQDARVRVFEPFYSTKNVGRGLGLAVVLGIVRSHGGTMELRTSPGKGASFRVALPVTSRAPDPDPLPAVGNGGRPLHGRILLADDEEGVRRACGGMLKEEGLEVVEVADGAEAVERYRAGPEDYDLVILDVSMPRMDGYQALEAMREIRPNVRVILSTGNVHDADEVEAKFGAPILAKPYGSEELRAAVARGLGRRPMTTG